MIKLLAIDLDRTTLDSTDTVPNSAMEALREAIDAAGLGYLETTSGAKGGVRYVPYISRQTAAEALEELRKAFEEPSRMLGSGFVYTSDIMFNPRLIRGAAMVFAKRFASAEDIVAATALSSVRLPAAQMYHPSGTR